MEPKRKTLKLSNKISELTSIQLCIDELAEKWHIAPAVGMTLNLVLEEAFTNVVNYAFDDNLEHPIEIVFEMQENILSICLIDDGKAYDPTQNATPDLSLSVEERAIGGLGVHLMKTMMDEVAYVRKAGKNRLLMRKKIQNE